MTEDINEKLNSPTREERLTALRESADNLQRLPRKTDVNNHIHTIYSFSPYSPTKAVWCAYQAGLSAAGIVDHDSVAGAEEFIRAGEIMNLPITIGFELRTTHLSTTLGNKRTNNPDQNGISYLTFHGVPHTRLAAVSEFLKPINKAREKRNRLMVARLNELLAVSLDYDLDVLPLSQSAEGGSVTERHILYALAIKLKENYQNDLVTYLKDIINVDQTAQTKLEAQDDPYFLYDLLGVLKSELVGKFYLPADDKECPDISTLVDFANTNGIILAYPYLGDIGVSVTGDKKAQIFEDGFLDELFEVLKDLGIRAVSYMPTRNTREQLLRLKNLCERHQMFQISGEDINSPRQSFICAALADPLFSNLIDNTWALIGHEKAATQDLSQSFVNLDLPLEEKIIYFRDIGKPSK